MATYDEVVATIRYDIDDVSARAFPTNDLYQWISKAAREISLAARNLRGEWSVSFAAAVATGNVQSNLVMQIDDAWWKFDSSEMRYPLQIMNHRDMHSRWGLYRDIRQGIPKFLTASKTSTSGALAVAAATMELRLYPIPQAAGVLSYQGTRAASIPNLSVAPTGSHQVECEVGWEYLLVKFGSAMALGRGRDSTRAAQLMAEYQDGLALLASFADQEHLPNSREYVPSYFGQGDFGITDDWSW